MSGNLWPELLPTIMFYSGPVQVGQRTRLRNTPGQSHDVVPAHLCAVEQTTRSSRGSLNVNCGLVFSVMPKRLKIMRKCTHDQFTTPTTLMLSRALRMHAALQCEGTVQGNG